MGRAALLLPIPFAIPENALADGVNVYIFWREGCPHCERALTFLERLQTTVPEIRVQRFEIWNEAANRKLFIEVGTLLQADISPVPLTVADDELFAGYLDDASTGAQIKDRAMFCLTHACPDSVRDLRAATGDARTGIDWTGHALCTLLAFFRRHCVGRYRCIVVAA